LVDGVLEEYRKAKPTLYSEKAEQLPEKILSEKSKL
jgi:hypothetical protein